MELTALSLSAIRSAPASPRKRHSNNRRALILVAPYASIAHVAAARFWWLPANLLVSERFDTAAKIGRIACPILLIHGATDTTIPPENSAALKALRPDVDRVLFPGVGHEVVFRQPAQALIAHWLTALGL